MRKDIGWAYAYILRKKRKDIHTWTNPYCIFYWIKKYAIEHSTCST